MKELKPCPFCGGEAEIYESGDNHRIYCTDLLNDNSYCILGALDHCCDFKTEDEATKAWNTRLNNEHNT